jgi:hypothetical protein
VVRRPLYGPNGVSFWIFPGYADECLHFMTMRSEDVLNVIECLGEVDVGVRLDGGLGS